jgi:hypothetical protein
VRRKLVPDDLPLPYATPSADNGARVVPRPAGALPGVPDGFVVTPMADAPTGHRRLAPPPLADQAVLFL